jgi:sirohydrochlorin ferrochelatase
MEALIQAVGVRGGFAILEHAYLSLEAPSIPEGVRRCVERGAGRIVVVPYFLHVGRHMVRDLPGILRAEQAKYPHVPIVLGRHLGQHEALVEIMLDRIIEAVSAPDAEALHGTDDAGFLIQVAPRDTASASTSSSGPSRSWSAWPPHTHSHQHGAWSSDRSS